MKAAKNFSKKLERTMRYDRRYTKGSGKPLPVHMQALVLEFNTVYSVFNKGLPINLKPLFSLEVRTFAATYKQFDDLSSMYRIKHLPLHILNGLGALRNSVLQSPDVGLLQKLDCYIDNPKAGTFWQAVTKEVAKHTAKQVAAMHYPQFYTTLRCSEV